MSSPTSTETRPNWRRLARAVGILFASLIISGLTAGVTVSKLEEQDRFCASCHVVPERTYYNRAQFALAGVPPAADLSSAHYFAHPENLPNQQAFRCIDCHRGDEGAVHRVTALTLGARDTAIYLFGSPDPAIEKTEIEVPALLTTSCLKCHVDTLLVGGFENHFHNKLPDAKQARQGENAPAAPRADAAETDRRANPEPVDTDLLCIDCHLAHVNTPGSELVAFLDVENTVYPACERCHIAATGSPLGLALTDETPTDQ